MLTWWCGGSRYADLDAVICDGAVRSGKTTFMGLSFFLWAMGSFNGMQFGICGKTIESLRRNMLAPLMPLMGDLGFSCEERVSRNTVTVRAGGAVNTFHIFGGKDEGSASLIQGVTFAGVLMDEVALMPRSFVEQACARCSVAGSKLWFNCNPEYPGHWFYTEWIKKAAERRALYIHFTMADNPALTPEIRLRYERLYSGVFYRRFVLGEWVAAEGLVYDFFDESYVKAAPETGYDRFCMSCDYGTANPMSIGLWGLNAGVWYRIREYYYDSRLHGAQKTDAEYAAELKKLAGDRQIDTVVVDPSAASFIECLRREGYNVVKAENDVLSGIRVTADMLKRGEIVICRECDDALREFSLYAWERGGGDRVLKKNDHAMDDIRYFAATIAAKGGGEDCAFAAVERG